MLRQGDRMFGASTTRRWMIRLALYGVPALLPAVGVLTGGAPYLLALVTIGALFCAAAIEREIDRVAPLSGNECSFCGRHRLAVRHLLTGPRGAAICESCLRACDDALGRQDPRPPATPDDGPWQPPT